MKVHMSRRQTTWLPVVPVGDGEGATALEWEPNEDAAWIKDAERWIAQIKSVRQCKIDLDPEGEISGVHVVAGIDREPRHIVRDVEGLLKARLGLNVYYKKIGVVQVVDPDTEGEISWDVESGRDAGPANVANLELDTAGATPAVFLEEDAAPRIQCSGVAVMASDMTVRAEVELQAGDVETRGAAEGPNHADSDVILVAKATVEAVRQLLDQPAVMNLAEVKLSLIGGETVVVAAVELVEGRRTERLFGTCPTSHNRQQAVVYAVLDALNRRLALMALKTKEAIG